MMTGAKEETAGGPPYQGWLYGADPDGKPVALRSEQWLHLMIRHPELLKHRHGIIRTIEDPTLILPDRQGNADRRRFCREDIGPSRWLVVVVDYSRKPAFVVTAWGARDEPSE